MDSRKKRLHMLVTSLSLLPLLYLLISASQFGFFGQWRALPAQILTDITLTTKDTDTTISLPYIMYDGTPGQSVVLTTQVEDVESQRLYFKSVYAPLRIYANDELLVDYGDANTYPSYMQDPSVKAATVELPNEPVIDLRFEYTYPTSRSDLILDTIMIGSYPAIFNALLAQGETSLGLHLIFIVLGLFFLCAGLLIHTIEPQGSFFIWLGMIAILCTLWGLGEYDLTGIFVQNESILSIVTFVSVFYLPVPIHCFFRSTIHYHNPRPMTICAQFSFFLATAITILQATAVLSFYNALPMFVWLTVASFVFGIGYTAYEWRKYENRMAKHFLLLWGITFLAALVEGIRFSLGHINTYGQAAQVALLIFLLINSVIGAVLIKKAVERRVQAQRLAQEYKIMEVQVLNQRRYHKLLTETRETLRQQRHDLHHQLTVVQRLANEGSMEKLNYHLESIISQVPEEFQHHCENMTVNAVVGYYIAKAQTMGVDVTVQLTVPERLEHINDSSLCVIFGNILENAVEACGRMEESSRFIDLNSYIRNDMLVISQKNSYQGHIHQVDDKFYSSKRDEFGIGLSSVESIARKHGGNATFAVTPQTFQSSIYVRI